MTNPVNAQHKNVVDYEPDCTERNGDVVSDVETCTSIIHSLLFISTCPIHTAKAKVKERIAVNGTPISQLRDVTCHMGSQCYLPPDTSERAPP